MSFDSPVAAAEAIRILPAELPMPGGGGTAARFAALWEIAARSPSLGRLAEAHYDGIAILCERGLLPAPGAIYGVWAASSSMPTRLVPAGSEWRLTGVKDWCSGASIATHALVTAQHGDTNALVLVDLRRPGVTPEEPTWQSPAFADIDTRSVAFDLELGTVDMIASDDWYLERAGFWHGAVGVAACWAGCAAGLVELLRPTWRDEAHALAHLGAIDADLWAMRAALDGAAAEIDANPTGDHHGRQRALRVRHVVDNAVNDITTRTLRALGPLPLARQPEIHRIIAECDLYRRQCHAERDLEQLGRLARGRADSL